MKTSGQFRGYKWANGPTVETQIGILIVCVYSPDWICQIFIPISVNPQVYLRGYQEYQNGVLGKDVPLLNKPL